MGLTVTGDVTLQSPNQQAGQVDDDLRRCSRRSRRRRTRTGLFYGTDSRILGRLRGNTRTRYVRGTGTSSLVLVSLRYSLPSADHNKYSDTVTPLGQKASHGLPVPLRRHVGMLTKLGLAVLTGNSALAIYRSRDDPRAVAFVAGACGGVALLFHFLRRLERGGGQGDDGGRTEAAVWLLTTLLTAMFASRVAPLMPPPVGLLVYLTAAGTAGAGFWALFLRRR